MPSTSRLSFSRRPRINCTASNGFSPCVFSPGIREYLVGRTLKFKECQIRDNDKVLSGVKPLEEQLRRLFEFRVEAAADD